MEQIPVIINGRRCGAIHFRREGAYMVCCGQVQYTGEMLRLWLYGNGAPVYLGVLIPDGRGGGSVRKKFSLSDFGRLPHPMRYCGGEGDSAEESVQPTHEADIVWYAMGDGTLVREDGAQRYVAFPADEVRLPRGATFLLRNIEGRQYVIFRM